uniref:CCHC-type domain-containing protein n=1 Tax=Lactuca sativa TaxID=4236 RepID=A0A9R1V6Q1_LACSA|nr:hypothetical protein LSAT_V11C600335610 [Lactuca sativa]
MLKDGFDKVLRKACSEFAGFGTPDVFLLNKLIHLKKLSGVGNQFEWCKVIPFKVLCFIWRARMGKIPLAVALNVGLVSKSITILLKIEFWLTVRPDSASYYMDSMSKFDNYGLPKSHGTSIPHEDDIPRFDRGTRDHASLPPPPPIILPNPQVRRLEIFKLTQALLASKHKEGKSVCAHVLVIKSHIDRLRMLGSIVCEEMAVDWVLQSLPNSYSEFLREYYMMNCDVTLIDLTYMLIAAESAMVWRNRKAKLIGESTFKASMDIDNDNERHAMIEKFDHKRKAMSEVVPCPIPKESTCFYCQEKGHWRRSCPIYLRDLRDGRVKTIEEKERKIKGRSEQNLTVKKWISVALLED